MAKLLGESINNVLRQSLGTRSKAFAEIVINWPKIVGSEFARDVSPTNIFSTKEKGQQINILYVSVNSSSVGLKLSYQQEMIIEKIAIYFGHKAVHKIKMKVLV